MSDITQTAAQISAKRFVRKVSLSVIAEALNPIQVWKHLLIILVFWTAYLVFRLPGFSDGLPIEAKNLFWPTIVLSTIAYLSASLKNFCAPVIAFVISGVLLLMGLKLEGLILNLYVYAGLIISVLHRR